MKTTAPFRDILFPTDFSKSSEAITDHVAGMAKAANAKVWLLSVVPWLEDWRGASESYFGPFSQETLAALEKDRRIEMARRQEMLQDFREKYFGSVQSECMVQSGGVADTIIDFAKEKSVGLIMIPTRAVGRRRPYLIGSTTAKVLHDAPCSVWTSPHPRELDAFRPYRQVVVAMDYRAPSTQLLLGAAEFAGLFGANLTVLSAIPPAGVEGSGLVQKLKDDLTHALTKQLKECKVKAAVRVAEGNPGDVIAEVAGDIEEADLIITGRGALDKAAHLQSHNYEIIWNAPCPVISLAPEIFKD